MAAMKLLGPDGLELPPQVRSLGQRNREMASAGHDSYFSASSRIDPDLALWTPSNPSGQVAISTERDAIATRVHDMVRNDAWAGAGIKRKVDSIIGSGWRLSAKPNARSLGLSPEVAMELATAIESAWQDYASDPDCCDAGQRLNMGAIQALGFRHWAADGEALALSLWLDRGGDYCSTVKIVDPDRLSNPYLRMDSVGMRAGVEMGAHGEPVAYHIRSSHPGEFGVIGAYPWIWDRVARRLPNGRAQVIHAFLPQRADEVRGIPPLAPVVKKLRMMGRYDEAELQAAVLNAVLAAFIKSPNDHEQIASALSGGDDISNLQDHRLDFYKDKPVKLEGVKLNFLFPTDEVAFSNPTHPNSNFEPFFRSGLRNIAAATGVSYEQLSSDWSQVNYSSARAAILEVWRGFTAEKDNFGAQFMAPIYSNWLEEAFANGKVKLPKGAPPFRAARQAYCNAIWIGPARGWVDPEKEAKAAIERLDAGLSTFERECAEQGMDYIEMFDQRARERKEMIARGLDPDALLRAKLPLQTQAGSAQPKPAGQQKPAPSKTSQDGNTE